MRKTVIALMIVLPIVFELVIFSSLNLVSVSVPISVRGIYALADDERLKEGEALYVDMADRQSHRITAEVDPTNASEKGYSIFSDNTDVLEADNDGYLTLKTEGTANVAVTSKDGGFSDEVPVVVSSSKPYDVQFRLYDGEGREISMRYSAGGNGEGVYTAREKLKPGKFTYDVGIKGGENRDYDLTIDGYVNSALDKGSRELNLYFSGDVTLLLTVEDGIVNGMTNRTLKRTVKFSVEKTKTESGIIINGGNGIHASKGVKKITFYVECEGEPKVTGSGIVDCVCLNHNSRANDNRHVMQMTLSDEVADSENPESFDVVVEAGGKREETQVIFHDFEFFIRSDIMETEEGGGYKSVILKNVPTDFYPAPAFETYGVEYYWSTTSDELALVPKADGKGCSVTGKVNGEYEVLVQPRKNGKNFGEAKVLKIVVTTKVNSIWINNKTSVDLAERYTVAGLKYGSDGKITENDGYAVELTAVVQGETLPVRNYYDGISFLSSNPDIATAEMRDGRAYLKINGTGEVEFDVQWQYAYLFGGNAKQTLKLYAVKDAVEANNYPELARAESEKRKVVLKTDIMLGTDADGEPLPLETRRSIADGQKTPTSYNAEFYSHDKNRTPEEAYVMYALEFTNDVYGNGNAINAEYFTNAVDRAGQPQIFKGPLVFVEYRGAASVAGQDNAAFLIRTDGIRLYGVTLLGCSDDSLYENEGGREVYRLNNLNKIGTTLEINADCEIINCRIRNGRNVIRVYGGNDGSGYMLDGVPHADLTEKARVKAVIEGCIISQGREFLIKVGSNKAIAANNVNGMEPCLTDENGAPYEEESLERTGGRFFTNNYSGLSTDENTFFYRRYVTTDLTVDNSVLETSGLFCIGVECNFSGALLYEGVESMTGMVSTYAKLTESWRHSGGTSLASVLRIRNDVRLYDWKDVSLVDSSTLIEPVGEGVLSELMKFDISAMLAEADRNRLYDGLLEKSGDNTFVHGGIAFYGGGRNYSQLDLSGSEDNGFIHVKINIGQFGLETSSSTLKRQAELLPYAAGTHDFNFRLYSSSGKNNYESQLDAVASGTKYSGIKPVPIF